MLEQSRYIPFSVKEVIALCAKRVPENQVNAFHQLANLLSAWYHHRLLADAGVLNEHFTSTSSDFAQELDRVARGANFEPITQADLNNALAEESMFRLRVSVDFKAFEKLVFYRRGPSIRKAERKRWFGLSKETIEFTNYDLVLVFVSYNDKPEKAKHSTLLKLFKNVPKADLEMLLPNGEIRMRNIDKLLIGVPAFVSGIAVLTTKIGGTLVLLGGAFGFWLGLGEPVTLDQSALLALLTASAALGGYLWRQYSNFKNRKIRFMKVLTENLYFKTVADDEGVISHLMQEYEAAETKEALLAYTTLLHLGSASATELSAEVETWLGAPVNFDIDDALHKLLAIDIVSLNDGIYRALEISAAFKQVDALWDDLFQGV